MFLDNLLNSMPIWLFILFVAFIISLVMTLVYKYTTDQERMKFLRAELKKTQEDMKKSKDNPAQFMKIQKKAMEYNLEYMRASFKPTLYTFIPIIIVFAWLNSSLMYEPLHPNEQFTIGLQTEKYTGNISLLSDGLTINQKNAQVDSTGIASWNATGKEGIYVLTFVLGERKITGENIPNILITDKQKYTQPVVEIKKEENLKKVLLNNAPTKPFGDLSIFGWNPGWLGTYIIFSLIFSMSMRKILKLN